MKYLDHGKSIGISHKGNILLRWSKVHCKENVTLNISKKSYFG